MQDFITYGLFGADISNSIKPGIFNAFFDELGTPAVYMPFPAEKGRLIEALPLLRSRFAGFNVESPFRLDIAAHMDKLDDTARQYGAVDTVKSEEGKLTGFNTCSDAFIKSLVGFMGNIYDKDILLIGSGGAAYSVANILMEKGAFLSILSRNGVCAVSLKEALLSRHNKNRIRVLKGLTGSDKFYAAVNTASVDMKDSKSEISISEKTFQNFKYVYDLKCGKTAFLKKAEEYGAGIKDGFDIMFYDCVGSLSIWLGKDKAPGVEVITKVYDAVKAQYLKT